ncbi:MAG: FtsW/RodA/SpoVE family cell cycle protein, partial [Armatimonadota bacterium]
MRKTQIKSPPDYWLLGIVLLLLLIGLFLVFNTSFVLPSIKSNVVKDPQYFLLKQGIFSIVGLFCMVFLMFLDLKIIKKLTFPIVAITLIGMIAVLFVGNEAYGAKRWLPVGSFQFQPSELQKIAVVLYLAYYFSAIKGRIRSLNQWWKVALFLLPVAVLTLYQKDLGTVSVIAIAFIVFIICAGVPFRQWFPIAMLGIVLIGIFIYIEPYRLQRFLALADPWEYYSQQGYQPAQSILAIARGGLFGMGLCQGRGKVFIPESHTDYIFSTFSEELGLVGSLILLSLFFGFTYRAFIIAQKSKSSYGSLLAIGCMSMISVQAIINISVACNI